MQAKPAATLRRSRRAIGALVTALLLIVGCRLFSPLGSGEDTKGKPDATASGYSIEVVVGGLEAGGTGSSRAIFADSNVGDVLVSVYNSSRVLLGSSYLVKKDGAWRGFISLPQIGEMSLEAIAHSARGIPLYGGKRNATIYTGNQSLTIGVTKTLVAEYLFAGNANDTSGNGINGTVYGDAVAAFDRFGESGKSFTFDGDGDYAQMAADALPTADRTVSLWFYANGITEGMGLIGYGGDGSNGSSYWESLNLVSSSQYTVGGYGVDHELSASYMSAPIGRWVHWVVTTAAAGTKLYIDGTELNSSPMYLNNTFTTGKHLFLAGIVDAGGVGPYVTSGNSYFSGRLDDVRIYNCALGASDVAALYHEGSYEEYTGLVGEWLFNGNADDTSGGKAGMVSEATLAPDRFGTENGCYSFDGVNDYIEVPGFAGSYDKYTISFWRKSLGASSSTFPRILRLSDDAYFSHGGPAQYNMMLYFSSERTSIYATQDEWHHILLKNDGSTLSFYVDGEAKQIYPPNAPFTVNRLMIGGDAVAGQYFYGAVDDLRIYNRSVTAEEISALYHEDGWALPKEEPSEYPTALTHVNSTKIKIYLSWLDAAGPVAPDGYLVKWSDLGFASIVDPVDGIPEADGACVMNVAPGVQQIKPTGLPSGTTYYFKIWPYTNARSDIDYKQGTPPQISAATDPSEPSYHPTAFACGTATATDIPLTWIDATAGTVLPEYYLIKWSSVGYGDIAEPVDGTAYPDGAGVKNVAQGAQACTASGLNPSTLYYFKIWPYTITGSPNPDYKLGSECQASGGTL